MKFRVDIPAVPDPGKIILDDMHDTRYRALLRGAAFITFVTVPGKQIFLAKEKTLL